MTLVLSSLDFSFGTAFLLLLAGGDFATGSGVSAKGFAEGAGSGTSGVADGGRGGNRCRIIICQVGWISHGCLRLRSLLCNDGIMWFYVMVVVSEPSVALIVDDPK